MLIPNRRIDVLETSALVPDFTAAMSGDQSFSLSSFKGSKLVLYFYPKDNTPGCTTEAINFRDVHDQFAASGARVFGISRDSLRSHDNFKAKFGLPFELISDPDEAVCNLFGVMKMKKLYGRESRGIERSTFVIDRDGKLAKAWRGLKVNGHVDEVLAFVQTLA
jgi:peroxiredoxin Q/BCP